MINKLKTLFYFVIIYVFNSCFFKNKAVLILEKIINYLEIKIAPVNLFYRCNFILIKFFIL